jgi:sulfur carrier protein
LFHSIILTFNNSKIDPMVVFVNNEILQLEQPETIPEILKRINIPEPKGIAVAINNAVVAKVDWGKFTVNENDKVTVIRATQGG